MNNDNVPPDGPKTHAGNGKHYGEYLPESLKEKYEEQLRDNTPNDLTADIARMRASSNLVCEAVQSRVAALKEKGETLSLEEIEGYVAQVAGVTESIRRLIDTQARVNPQHFISVDRMKQMIIRVMEIIRNRVPDMEAKKAIVADLQRISVSLDEPESRTALSYNRSNIRQIV